MADYPAAARQLREQGRTGFFAVIEADGAVSDCEVLSSSGSPRLDLATCQLFKRRASFESAIDFEGKPIIGFYTGTVNWTLGLTRDAPLPGTITRSFLVEADGRVSDCRIVKVTGAAAQQYRKGPEPCRTAYYYRNDLPTETRKRKRVTEIETIVVSEVPAPAQ